MYLSKSIKLKSGPHEVGFFKRLNFSYAAKRMLSIHSGSFFNSDIFLITSTDKPGCSWIDLLFWFIFFYSFFNCNNSYFCTIDSISLFVNVFIWI